MEKTHEHWGESSDDILKGAIIKFDFWDWEQEIIPKPIPRFAPGIQFHYLEEILFWVKEAGFLDDYKVIFAWFTQDRKVNIKHRLKWKGTTSSLVRFFDELIEHNILDRRELTTLSNKLSTIFVYLNKSGEFVPVQKSAVQSSKNISLISEYIKGNKEVKSINCVISIILARLQK
ncbi:hypothetical protein [uncultured Fluviicola sp.]|uniref:hypothetical protein n=1 Tax=uncultured Fluviicola sp. TaxID=463303 RepID=UPI0025F97D0B|nr:hypothetical protein [uncultured Fluviicola sp.]